jgi:hypothetical protein|tara:strand:- start:37 stop:363 length:327 start_codon:yes stop_codon:yes gene_type:complete
MAVAWNVISLDSTKKVGSLSDVVTTVHWTASDSETVGEETYTGSSYGSIGLAEADTSSFTAYADIKESDAVAWAKAAIGTDEVTAIETNIAAQITEAKTPTISSGVPW